MNGCAVVPAQCLIGIESDGADAPVVECASINLRYAFDLLVGANFAPAGKSFAESSHRTPLSVP